MTAAAKTPPLIAPGILCPKCKGPMLDERASKRSDKSPDYTCANMLCTDPSGKYRTAIWEKGNGQQAGGESNAGTPASAPSADAAPDKPKLSDMYLKATEFVLEKIVPLYHEEDIAVTDIGTAAMVHSLFSAAAKER